MENSVVVLIVAGLSGLVVGVGLAWFLMRRGGGDHTSAAQVEAKLKDYQTQVDGHFAKTSELIDELTDSYRKVFDHLNDSAHALLTEEQIQQQIENRRDRHVTLSYLKNRQPEQLQDIEHTTPDTVPDLPAADDSSDKNL